jgi:hypothetical protein
MELLLNIAWVLLAVPAVWVWLRASNGRAAAFSRLSCMLVLGCMLLLLFPVVSASDDLHAMRPEVEESSLSKKASQHASANDSHSACSCHGPQLAACPQFAFSPDSLSGSLPVHHSVASSQQGLVRAPGWRAPPVSFLS